MSLEANTHVKMSRYHREKTLKQMAKQSNYGFLVINDKTTLSKQKCENHKYYWIKM